MVNVQAAPNLLALGLFRRAEAKLLRGELPSELLYPKGSGANFCILKDPERTSY
ncbi:hypothetical protein E4U21_003884 [Claviceps maximensis]|nr:hypothetical protein E4U21_003884 [Claviceps maximensis]